MTFSFAGNQIRLVGRVGKSDGFYFENDRVVRQPTETISASDSLTANDTNQAATAGTAGSAGVRGVFWRGGAIAPGFKLEEVLPTLTKKTCDIIHERAKRT